MEVKLKIWMKTTRSKQNAVLPTRFAKKDPSLNLKYTQVGKDCATF